MLKKLIKYDIRATWRDFTGIYLAILLGVLIVPFMFNNVGNQFLAITGGFIAFGIVIAVIVVMIINLFKIFNTNIYSKEGYLTLTLPVSSTQILGSKLIVSSMWIIMTMLVAALGLFIFILMLTPVQFADVLAGIRQVLAQLNGLGASSLFLLAIAAIVSALKEVSKLFLACSVAHFKPFNKFRVPAGILSYFALSWMENVIIQIGGRLLGPLFEDKILIMNQFQNFGDLAGVKEALDVFNWALVLGILYALFLSIAYNLGNRWILNNKLDLD